MLVDDGAVGSWSDVVFRENFGGSALHVRAMRVSGSTAAGITNVGAGEDGRSGGLGANG